MASNLLRHDFLQTKARTQRQVPCFDKGKSCRGPPLGGASVWGGPQRLWDRASSWRLLNPCEGIYFTKEINTLMHFWGYLLIPQQHIMLLCELLSRTGVLIFQTTKTGNANWRIYPKLLRCYVVASSMKYCHQYTLIIR